MQETYKKSGNLFYLFGFYVIILGKGKFYNRLWEGNMDASTLLSIKDFSRFSGVQQSTLRYYDEIGLLIPAARGENNYRYYLPFQIIILNFINVLIDLGVPLAAIKYMCQNRTPESMIELLGQQENKLDHRLHELRTAYSIIHTFRDNIQRGLFAHDGTIKIEEVDDIYYVLGPANDFKDQGSFYETFINFCNSADEYRINLRYPIGGMHYDFNTFLQAPSQPNKFFSLDPLGNRVWPAGQYLVGYRRGYYGEFGDLPQKMIAYAEEHGLTFKGNLFVIYLLDEISIVEPDQYLSRIAVGVSEKNKTKRSGKK